MEEKILPRPAWLSLVGGILSFFLVCVPFLGFYLAIGCAIGGLITGIQAIKIINSDSETYKGMALAVIGTIVSSMSVLFFGALIVMNILGMAIGLSK
ncbi:MAG: hypothetical protein ABIJ56_02420 [Pseudomonadota bacterium]